MAPRLTGSPERGAAERSEAEGSGGAAPFRCSSFSPQSLAALRGPLWPEGLSLGMRPHFLQKKTVSPAKRTLMVPAPPQLSPLHCRSRSKSGGKMMLCDRWWSSYCIRSFRTLEHKSATLAPKKGRRRPVHIQLPLRGAGAQRLKGVLCRCGPTQEVRASVAIGSPERGGAERSEAEG